MKKIIVAYFPGDQSIVYALAACIKLDIDIHPVSSMHELWDIDSQKLILLQIDKQNPKFTDLELYLQIQGTKVIDQLNLSDLYSSDSKIEEKCIESVLIKESLRTINNVSEGIAKMTQGLTTDDALVRRYLFAIKSAYIKAKNTDDPIFYRRTLESIAREIAGSQANYDIDLLANFHQRVILTTDSALDRISLKHDIFKIPNRSVAYAYLSNISPWLDLDLLKQKAIEKYGYLVILQYRLHEEEHTWIGSNGRLNIEQFFDLPRKGKGNETLLIGSHRYISRFLREKISELTQ